MELLTLQPLAWLATLVLLAIGLRYSLVDRPGWQRWASLAFRAAGIAFLVIALCRPYWLEPREDLHVVFLVDVSESVDLAAIRKAVETIQQSVELLKKGDSWSLFAVGSTLRPFESIEALDKMLSDWEEGLTDDQFRSQSRLANALLKSRLAFVAGKARRVVLMSDGQETEGEIDAALRQLADEKIEIRWQQLESLAKPEAGVVSIAASSPRAFHGEVVRLQVKLASNRVMEGILRLVHKGVAVQQQEVKLKPEAANGFHFDVDMNTPGDSRWTAELLPAQDHFLLNNQSSCTVYVRGRPRVLALHRKPREIRSFARALREQEIEVDVRGELGVPETLAEALAFDAIVLADLPATAMTPRQMDMLKRYVIDFGGGLVMLGSDNSFGLGGYYRTPVEQVLPLVSRFEKEKEKPALAMILVIDKSGSMQGLPIQLARQAAKAAVELLSARDLIGVIGFDGAPQIISELRSAAEADAVQDAIDSLQAGGGTYMYPAMVEAKSMLETAPAKIRHMILLSDGHTQQADHQSLTQDAVEAGMTISTVALGGADKELLSSIAEIGKGRYYETDDPANVPQIFTKETMQASKSAIKEDLFGAVQTGDHPLLAGFDEADLPFSLGYVMTEVKPTAQMLLAAETGDPLLAVGRYGLGTGLAYTSDLTERWGGEWLAWDSCGKFWAQALRSVVRKADNENFEISQDVQSEQWRVQIKRTASDGSPINGINWEAIVVDQYGRKQPVAVREFGLGLYEVEQPLTGQERLTLRLLDRGHDKVSVLHYLRPYPAEYQLARKLPDVVSALASFDASSIRADVQPVNYRRSISHLAYFAALTCLLAGVLLRRI